MIAQAPSRSDVQARLGAARAEILGLGVRRLALFGSVRRDTARPDSDVDLLVEFEPEQKSLEHLVALGDLLEVEFLVEVRATLTRQSLDEDAVTQRAVVRSLEIIREASKRVP